MNYKNLLILFLPILSFGQEFSPAIQNSREEVESILEEYPGVSIAVGVKDEIVWAEGFGFANAETKTPVTSSHSFYYYSLSKSIIGLAIYKLVQADKINLDEPVTTYDPNLPSHYADVTIRTLLNHSAGVRHYNKGEWIKISMNNCQSTAEALDVFINDPLTFTPGTKHSYSSFGYVLLSHLIEKITGDTFDDHIVSEVFKPRSIDKIQLSTGSDLLGDQATRYEKWKSGKNTGKEAVVDNSCKFGGGGYIGTASALALLHMNVLQEEKANKHSTLYSTLNPDLRTYTYGLGINTSAQGVNYYIHTGSGMGGSAILLIYPDYDLTIVILGNIQSEGIKNIVGNIGNNFLSAIND